MERRRRDSSGYHKRSGGININNSRVDTEGDIAGRDIHKTVNIPPEEQPDPIKSVLRSSFTYAVATVGMWLCGGSALIAGLWAFGFFGEEPINGFLACGLVVALIILGTLAFFFYTVASRTEK